MKQSMPITIKLIRNEQTSLSFSSELLIVFALQGNLSVTVNEQQYGLTTGGILSINPFAHYSLSCRENSEAIVLHIPQEMLQITGLSEQSIEIKCYIADDSSGMYGEYDQIRKYYARIFKVYFQDSEQSIPRLITYTSQLLSVLSERFVQPNAVRKSPQDLESIHSRYERILQFIHEHWREPITIDQIAKQEYISTGYLSRFFKKYVGLTLTEYLTELRLKNAARDLANTEKSVTDIAYTNGFKSVNSFIEHFKTKYGDTPKQFQKHARSKNLENWRSIAEPVEHDGISVLLQYASLDEQTAQPIPLPTENRQVLVDANAKGRRLRHTWRRLLNIGYARDGLLAEVQNQIRQAQRQIGFEYLRFHGILDDDMHVYHEDEHHNPFLDFSRVDLLLDFVLSLNMKPYIELGLIPKLLAKEEKLIYDRISFCTIYNDEAKWKFLIEGLIQHCIERYGHECVLEWRFTTISITIVSVGFLSLREYLSLYRATYCSVKRVDHRLQFGGPGGIASSIRDSNLVQTFFEFSKKYQCLPDFICTQIYPHHSIEDDKDFIHFSISQTSAPSILSSDEHYTHTVLRDYRNLLELYGLSHLKIWIEEWNSTLWQRDISSDTCYKAAWLVKNLCENYDEAESFGYWLLSDFIEEHAAFGKVFHGGYGLFTYNGLPKSGWCAMQLMNMLGDTALSSGDGWMATKTKEGIQIVVSHYCHYDNLYRFRYQTLTDPKDAYTVFVERGLLKYFIRITGLTGRYELKSYRVTPKHGSSFDAWLYIGAPRYLHEDEMNYLKNASQPYYHIETLELRGEYTLESSLEAHEIQVFLLQSVEPPI